MASEFISGFVPLFVGMMAIALTMQILKEMSRRDRYTPRYSYKDYHYRYTPKPRLMTQAEQHLFDFLSQHFAAHFHLFPQIHLDTLFDHVIKGQSWQGALSHIQRKSVDFVICDKQHMKPLMAIELDDHSHDRPDRVERDAAVEAIFNRVDLILLRIPSDWSQSADKLRARLDELLPPN